MSTAAQQVANQANAQHSTGPKTPEGKQRAAANSRTHGFCSATPLIAPEDQPIFAALEAGFRRELALDGPLEEAIFRTLIHAHWNQIKLQDHFLRFTASKPDLVSDPEAVKTYERLQRYMATADRTFNRALRELKALQVARTQLCLTEDPTEAGVPLLAATVLLKNTKRTQSEPVPAASPRPTTLAERLRTPQNAAPTATAA